MNAVGILVLAISLGMVVFASRRWAAIGAFVGVLYLTQGQQFQLMGVTMFAVRFVGLFAFLRVIAKRELKLSRLLPADKLLIALLVYWAGVFVLRSDEQQINRIGTAIDFLFAYLAFRGLIVTAEDYRWFLRRLLILLVPFALLVIYESLSRNNLFSSMGAVTYGGDEWVRGGRLRSQGSFRQASLLGTIGACFLPLYISLWMAKLERKAAALGIITSMAIVWASNSGGPASAAMVALCGWGLWMFRSRLKAFRIVAVLGVAVLAVSMKAPIWYLLAKLGSVTGGSGWHRARLLDMSFQNIDKWWFAGMRIEDTRDWFPYVLSITGGADITNQYLFFAIDSGLIAMILFIAVLSRAFRDIGRSLVYSRLTLGSAAPQEYILWGLGVMLAVHCLNWMSITYFDQTYVVWFFQLAVVTNLTAVRSNLFEVVEDAQEVTSPESSEPILES